jgi:hypothetical protein
MIDKILVVIEIALDGFVALFSRYKLPPEVFKIIPLTPLSSRG